MNFKRQKRGQTSCQCEYKPGVKWSVLGQMLLPPCEEEKKNEKKQDRLHLGQKGVYSQRVEVHVIKTVELYMLTENIVLLLNYGKLGL